MDGDSSSRMMSGFIAVLGGQWVTYAIAIVTTAYITRVLGPGDYAKFIQMQFIVAVFGTIFGLSIPSAVSRYTAEHAARGEKSRSSGVLKTGLKTTIVTGTAASVIMFLFSKPLASIVIGDGETVALVELLAVSAGVGIATSPLNSYVYGLQRFRACTLISVLSFAFWRISLIVALFLGSGLYGVSFAWMFASIVLSLGIAIPVLRMAGGGEAYPVSRLLSYSMPLFLSTSLGFLWQWIDSLLLPYIGSMGMLAMTNIAMTLINVSFVLLNSASSVLFTHFVEVDATQGREAMLEAGYNISRLLSYCFVPIGFFVGGISNLLVFVYAGEAFLQATLLLRFLSPFLTIGTVLFIIWSNEVTATGSTRLLLLNTIITLTLYLAMGIVLVPWLGEAGYVVTRVLHGIVVFPYMWRKMKTLNSVRFDFRALFLSAFVSTVIIVPATLVETLTSNYLLTSITSVLGVACYVFIVTNFGLLTRDETRLIFRLFTQSLKFQNRASELNPKISSKSDSYESLKTRLVRNQSDINQPTSERQPLAKHSLLANDERVSSK